MTHGLLLLLVVDRAAVLVVLLPSVLELDADDDCVESVDEVVSAAVDELTDADDDDDDIVESVDDDVGDDDDDTDETLVVDCELDVSLTEVVVDSDETLCDELFD